MSNRYAGLDGMVTVAIALISIALGTPIGASIYKSLTEILGSWRLQLGRARRYWRRGRRKK